MLTQIIGQLCEDVHLDGMLESVAPQHGFTHKQYIGILQEMRQSNYKTGRAVNGGQAPFILTVDWFDRFCY